MPELPEVETTRRGLAPHLVNQRIRTAIVRNRALRVPVPRALPALVAGATVRSVDRRGKYLLIDCGHGTLIIHLGMSGRLWLVDAPAALDPHDHFNLVLENGRAVGCATRAGSVSCCGRPATRCGILCSRTSVPSRLSSAFSGKWLYDTTRNRSCAVKLALMDSHVVAGIGNIYASEALFRAKINPKLPAHRIGRARYDVLAEKIRETLEAAIRAGGSTLRDLRRRGRPGGLFPGRASGLRTAGDRAVPAAARSENAAGAALDVLLPGCQRRWRTPARAAARPPPAVFPLG